jgi:hypothetical protein
VPIAVRAVRRPIAAGVPAFSLSAITVSLSVGNFSSGFLGEARGSVTRDNIEGLAVTS